MASVVNIGFLSVVTVWGFMCFGAGGAHTLLVAVEPAADCFRVAAVGCRRGRNRCFHVLDRARDQEASRTTLGEAD
jgi:hypothetical protein